MHNGVMDSALGFGSRHPRSGPGRANCMEALSPYRGTAGGQAANSQLSLITRYYYNNQIIVMNKLQYFF